MQDCMLRRRGSALGSQGRVLALSGSRAANAPA